jgi:hypothetical protein
VHYALRVEKILSTWSWCRTFRIYFLRPRGCLTNPFGALLLCFGVIGKTPGLIFRNNFVKKKNLFASVIAIMFWQDVTRSSLCSGFKECGTERAHNLFFSKSSVRIQRTTALGMFKDTSIILDAIRRSFLTKSATAAMFISVQVDYGRSHLSSSSTSSLPSRTREYHLKSFDRFRVSFPQAFCTNISVSVTDRPALKQNFMGTLCSFPPSMTYKENWLYKL